MTMKKDVLYGLLDQQNTFLGFWVDKLAVMDYIETKELEEAIILTVTKAELAVLPDPVITLEEMTRTQMLDMVEDT